MLGSKKQVHFPKWASKLTVQEAVHPNGRKSWELLSKENCNFNQLIGLISLNASTRQRRAVTALQGWGQDILDRQDILDMSCKTQHLPSLCHLVSYPPKRAQLYSTFVTNSNLSVPFKCSLLGMDSTTALSMYVQNLNKALKSGVPKDSAQRHSSFPEIHRAVLHAALHRCLQQKRKPRPWAESKSRLGLAWKWGASG